MIKFLKNNIENRRNSNPILYFYARRLWQKPYLFGLDFVFCYLYSSYLSYKLFGLTLFPKVFFSSDVFRVVIIKSAKSRVHTNAKMPIIFESFIHGVDRTVLTLANDSDFFINNTFHIGNGCAFSVAPGAKLTLVGEKNSCTSGVTCQSKILCSENIHIGGGSIISWNTYITDSNNHLINGALLNKPVYIGDHVWISEGCTISPGSLIGSGSIVGAKSFVNDEFQANTLIVGCPAITKKTDVFWAR